MKKTLIILVLFFSFQNAFPQLYSSIKKTSKGIDLYGYTDGKGNIKIERKYPLIFTDTLNTIAFVINRNYELIAIDSTGQKLFNVYKFDNGPDYISEGLFRITKKNKVGYADIQGNIIIEPVYFAASPFKNNIAKVTKQGVKKKDWEYTIIKNAKWGIINKQGELIVPFFYDEIIFLNNGNIELINGENKIQIHIISLTKNSQ